MSSILECSNLSKIFNEGQSQIEVLQEVNLQVKKSELIAIVGSSGSGKSTLLHLLGGLDLPTSGQVRIAGKDIFALSEKDKCYLRNVSLGFVYQFHHLLPEFTALENVSMPLLIRGINISETENRAEHMLGLVGLQKRLTHKTGQLSGGERQRVAIARALVGDPMCVLADEPTGNLDPRNAEKVLQLFFDLQASRNTSVVMVTHDRNIARKAQRVFSLEEGRLKELLTTT
jgi:lipoprotein-releasing system ATP-binding protein